MPDSKKEKTAKKAKVKKDSQLVIRLNGEMRDDFIALCDEMDTSAAREIRRFITAFLNDNRAAG